MILPIIVFSQSTVHAQSSTSSPSSPAMEDRVSKLETNIGLILDLLKKQQSQQNQAASPNSSAATAVGAANSSQNQAPVQQPTQKLKKGPILEIWTINKDSGDTFPTDRSVGASPDLGESFALSNVNKITEFSSLATTPLAFQWSGKINVKEKGTYVFLVQGNKSPGWACSGSIPYFWYIGLDIENENIISEKTRIDYDPTTFPLSTQINLQPGMYTLKLKTFFPPRSNSDSPVSWNYKLINITVKMRGPSDNVPVAIGNMNGNLNHLESN